LELDARKQRVLQAIVEDYIATAEPVGSRTVARKYRLGVSSATIRNEMADLEELGYLEQPHTSAGRVPSDRGYRFYVDRLMHPSRLPPEVVESIVSMYRRRVSEVESLIQATARVLSESTNYLAFVLGPQFGLAQLQYLHFLPLNDGQAILVLVTDTGLAENRLISIPEGTGPADLWHIGEVLNRTLTGLTMDRVTPTAWRELNHELSRYRGVVEQVIELLEQLQSADNQERLYLGGATNILGQPEFKDVDKARAVLGLLEESQSLCSLLSEVPEGLSIIIGEENRLFQVRECSLVSASYRIGGKSYGRLAVLGPRRMDYARVVSTVRLVEEVLSDTLSRNVG
jgi:heat-inducible transcriptional repressor